MPTDEKPILVIAGTNRPDANALRVAKLILAKYQNAGVPASLYSLSEMPQAIFEPTCYAEKPAGWSDTTDRVVNAAGLHVVTPEYNGSFPGVLKYFIDMLPFPDAFDDKPVTFTGEAAGNWGAFRSIEQLMGIFGYRNARIYATHTYIPGVGSALTDSGALKDEDNDKRISEQCFGFAKFCTSLSD
ncbi:MAG: NAD(P)H-dependent oxidoreductase [Planctomycetota bacterium]